MNLEKFAGAMRRQSLILVGVMLIGALTFAAVMLFFRTYAASAGVVAFSSGLSSSGGDSATADPLKDPSSALVAPQDVPALVDSTPLLTAVVRAAKLGTPNAKTLDALKRRIKIKNTIGSEIISLSVTDRVPERAIATVNVLTEQLRTFESRLATARYDALIGDLRGQIQARADALRSLDVRIAALSGHDPFLSADDGSTPVSQQIIALQQQYNQVQATLQADGSALAVAARRPGLARALAAEEIITADPAFVARRTQFGKDVAQRDQTEAGYTEAFPGLAGLNDQVEREKDSLLSAQRKASADPGLSKTYVAALLDANKAAGAFASDKAQLAQIRAQLHAAKIHLDDLNAEGGPSVQLSTLRRNRDAESDAFASLSQRLAQTIADRSQAASIGTVVIVDPAIEALPTPLSQPAVVAALALVAFGWLAISLALAADAYDTRLRDRGAVERLYGRPVLTTV
jgi:capsular polysaccharide biosynthesis protein